MFGIRPSNFNQSSQREVDVALLAVLWAIFLRNPRRGRWCTSLCGDISSWVSRIVIYLLVMEHIGSPPSDTDLAAFEVLSGSVDGPSVIYYISCRRMLYNINKLLRKVDIRCYNSILFFFFSISALCIAKNKSWYFTS